MRTSSLKDPVRITASPPTTAEEESPDRRSLFYLLSFLLAGLESAQSTRLPAAVKPAEWPERWEDDEYTYLETRIPGDSSDLELDLNVSQGVIFARIRQRRAESAAEDVSPHAEMINRARDARA